MEEKVENLGNEEQKQEQPAEEEKQEFLTFDDILKDKDYQAEFDRRISKAIETSKAKWQTNADKEKETAIAETKTALETRLKDVLTSVELKNAKARDNDVVLKLIDSSKITLTDDGITGLTEQIDALKETKSYLFDIDALEKKSAEAQQTQTTPTNHGKTGLNHGNAQPEIDDERIRAMMGLKPKK